MTRKKSNKTAFNNTNSDRPTKNIIKNNNNNTIEAAFKRIQNIRQCPKCNKKMDYSIYLQHYEKCKNREGEVEEDDDDIIFCGEGQGHKENEQVSREVNNSKKNQKRTDKSSVVVNVEDEDSRSNSEAPRSSALNSGIVSENVFDGNARRAPASPITICDDSSNEVPITSFKPKNYCSDLPLAQIYDLCVERLQRFLNEQEELLRNLPPPKCDTNRPMDLTDENDSLMDSPPTENLSNKLLPVHYSLRFVWQIIQKALHCVKNGHGNILETATKFWGDSLRKVYSFLTTSVSAQQLFCRILVRRRGFHIARNIRYHDLGPKLMPLFIELCENGFFEEAFSINENGDPNSSNITLDEAFNLLQVDDFKIICKKFHIDTRIGRQGIIRELKKHAIRRDVFGRCNLKHLLNCIKQLTGKCYRIKQDALYFFNSFFSVYAPNLMDVGAAAVRPHQCYVDLCDQLIFSMLQRQAETLNFVNNLNLKYSLIDLFSDFDGLTRYVKAKYDEQRLVCLIDKSLFEEAKSVAAELKELFLKEFLEGEEDAKIFQFINLPVYLRKFTPPWIYCRCIFRGVEAAQRLRDYELAVNWLIFLLSKQELKHFCINSRGRWYKRLVLNLNKHLKRNEEAAKFCCLGIEENFVLVSDKLSLQERLDKLSQRVVDCPQALLEKRLVLDEPEKVSITGLTLGKGLGDGLQVNHFYIPSTSTQPNVNENVQPETTFQSDTLSSSSDTSSCSSFTSTKRGRGPSGQQQPSTQTTTAPTNNTNINKCNVEEIALRHFIENENYKEGVHAEGKIWHMLFRLFFWDIISCVEFENELANNVWISWMQNDPLDLNYTMFYENRLNLIDARLEKILDSLSECILNKTSSTTFEERIPSSSGSPQRKSPRKSLHCPCFIHSTVDKHYNEKLSKTMGNSARSSTIEWHDFEGGKEQLLRFLHCCSPVLLHALFKKLCSNFRQSRSGFPDLTLWNAEDRKLAVVEVKGPNDKLSTKQQIWLDFFKSQGVRAVVCHVSAKNDRSIE